ncbi:hypothetical protein JKP88DRAFT_199804 [Tribonema minus]|uniref:Ankyrin repeat-containing domain n=1 Tax=Tribonema minus TaxID=303371 RepID=A0A835Z3I0_9STRA|nr:hypothetical protein JKP88DRAFT_199804 [Tribonema minus]
MYVAAAERAGGADALSPESFSALKAVFRSGCMGNHSTTVLAMLSGNLPLLQWLSKKGLPPFQWHIQVPLLAAACGHTSMFMWAAVQERATWSPCVYSDVLFDRNYDLLNWVRQYSLPGFDEVTTMAAESGDLHILQRVVELGYPWEAQTACAAAESGNLEVLIWAVENHCPFDAATCLEHATSEEVRAWIQERLP